MPEHFVHYCNHAGFCRRGWYQGETVDDAAVAIVRDHCPFVDKHNSWFVVEYRQDVPEGETPWIYVKTYSDEINCGYESDPGFWFTSRVVAGSEQDCTACAGTGSYVTSGTPLPGRPCWKCKPDEYKRWRESERHRRSS